MQKSQTQSTLSAEPAIRFADVSAKSGLDFINVSGSAAQDYVLESMSAGAAFLDYDGDGYQDLFVVNGTRLRGSPPEAKNILFHNELAQQQTAIGRRYFAKWRPISEPVAGVWVALRATTTTMAMRICTRPIGGPNQLYRNDGDGRFTERAKKAGVADARWGSSAAFGDLDARWIAGSIRGQLPRIRLAPTSWRRGQVPVQRNLRLLRPPDMRPAKRIGSTAIRAMGSLRM